MKSFTNETVATFLSLLVVATASTMYEIPACSKLDATQCRHSSECVTVSTHERWVQSGSKLEYLCVEKKAVEGSCFWGAMYEIRDQPNCASVPGCVWIEEKDWCVPESMVSSVANERDTTASLRGSSFADQAIRRYERLQMTHHTVQQESSSITDQTTA